MDRKSDFNCPGCGQKHTENDYHAKLMRGQSHIVKINCAHCKKRLAVTIQMTGEAIAWLDLKTKNNTKLNQHGKD